VAPFSKLMYPAHVWSIFTTSRSCFGSVQIPKVLTVLSSNAPSAPFEPLKQRQHNDSQPTIILWDQALCGERAICSSNQVCRIQATRQVSPSDPLHSSSTRSSELAPVVFTERVYIDGSDGMGLQALIFALHWTRLDRPRIHTVPGEV
jgi:hypothetical protein